MGECWTLTLKTKQAGKIEVREISANSERGADELQYAALSLLKAKGGKLLDAFVSRERTR